MQSNAFLKYTDGTPVAYQVWNNYLIKNQKFQIQLNRDPSHKYFYKTYVEKIKIAQTKLQPESQYGDNNCVLMITAVVTEKDWITIPCFQKNSHLILC